MGELLAAVVKSSTVVAAFLNTWRRSSPLLAGAALKLMSLLCLCGLGRHTNTNGVLVCFLLLVHSPVRPRRLPSTLHLSPVLALAQFLQNPELPSWPSEALSCLDSFAFAACLFPRRVCSVSKNGAERSSGLANDKIACRREVEARSF